MIPPVVASERGRAQARCVATHTGGCRTTLWHVEHERNILERMSVEGDRPVREVRDGLVVS